jgi:aspartate racemase
LLDALQNSASRLVHAGAQVIAMPCNTAHVVYDELQAACPAEILHLVGATCAEVEQLGFARPALIATRGTLQSRLYQRMFAHPRLLLPDDELLEAIDWQIMEVKAGRYGSANATFRRVTEDFRSRGADCVVLACTDIPLAIDPTDGPLPMLDTCAILARAAVARCLYTPEPPGMPSGAAAVRARHGRG